MVDLRGGSPTPEHSNGGAAYINGRQYDPRTAHVFEHVSESLVDSVSDIMGFNCNEIVRINVGGGIFEVRVDQ